MSQLTDGPTRDAPQPRSGGIGTSVWRADGVPKVTGAFPFASDLSCDGMLWGAMLRSPHPSARIRAIDTTAALRVPGVRCVLTHDDLTWVGRVGVEHADQPVVAGDVVRFHGEPVALVAADDLRTARVAAARIAVEYEVLRPVTDPREALASDAPLVHPGGNLVRHRRLRIGDVPAAADVVVTGEYHTAMQDPAFLDTEAGLAIPDGDGGLHLHVATQGLHGDQRQICAALGLPPERVRLTLAGVGGAFGGREDLSLHVPVCVLALRLGRPVKMVYTRAESFLGHPHRHPAVLRYEHGFRSDGTLVWVRAEILLDGGAYASSTGELVGNVAAMAAGPYVVPSLSVDCYGAYTNNPPAGAMRGFGMVQVAFAYESQMDRAAVALGMDPLELRGRNALHEGARVPTGAVLDSPAPVAELLRRVRDMPLPPRRPDLSDGPDLSDRGQGGPGHLRRGIGYAVAYKSIAFGEGFDDYSTARVRLEVVDGEPRVTVHTAAADVGQGITTVQAQICRTELGIDPIVFHPVDTTVGSAGPTSASRQTYVTGGAVKAACEQVRERVLALASVRLGQQRGQLRLENSKIVSLLTGTVVTLAEVLGSDAVEQVVTWRHRPTVPIDERTGQGFAHVQYAFVAHRAVVDVDVELGSVRVVELACAQDVGKAINPQGVEGQIHGGTAQGLGLALMEQVRLDHGSVTNTSFRGYLVPTIVDMPQMRVAILECADPHAPYGLRGVGEPATISSTPAIVAAIRAATGRDLCRVPVRPEDILGLARPDDDV